MSANVSTIAKNFGFVSAAQLITWAMGFLIAIFLPRYLGVTAVGQFSIAVALWLIMGVLIAFGMDTYLTKSIAREPDKTPILVSTSIMLRCLLFIPAGAAVTIYLYVAQFSIEIFYVAAIIGAATLLGTISQALIAAFGGLERMQFSAIVGISSKTVLTTTTLVLLLLGFNVYWIATANIFGNLVGVLVGGYFLNRHYPLRFSFSYAAASAMLRSSSPFLIAGATLIFYQEVDKLFIAKLTSVESVGWYATATALVGTLMFVPATIGIVIFPSLSRSFISGHEQLSALTRRAFDLMFLIGVPVGFGLIIVADPLVALLYGPEFAPTADILAVMGLVLLLTYINTLFGHLLIAAERVRRWNLVLIAMAVATLPLDLVLVPWADRVYNNGGLGGAIAFTITELGMLIGAIWLLPKGVLHWSNIRTVLLTVLAGLIMITASWWLRENYMFLAIIVGALTYTGLALLLRIVPRDDLLLLLSLGRRVLTRLGINRRAPASLGSD